MRSLIGKFNKGKYNSEDYNTSNLETFNSGKDVYYDAKRIPINIDSFKIINNNSDLLIDSKFLKKPISRISSDKILNFLRLSNKVRFFVSNRDPKKLVSCTFSNGSISVFINCHQIYQDNSQKLCKDSSIVKIDEEIYRIVSPELESIVRYINYFYESYNSHLNTSVDGKVNISDILEKKYQSNIMTKFLDFLKNFNYPSLDKFFISMDKINHLSDEDFDNVILNHKFIEIQKIYP
jgi:hypothetical protein